MAIRVVEFSSGGKKLERFLTKNQHIQWKFLKLENWSNGEPQQLAKIKVFKVDYFDFSCKKKLRKIRMIFDIDPKLKIQ